MLCVMADQLLNPASPQSGTNTPTKKRKNQPMTKYSIAKFCALAAGISIIPAVSFAGTPSKEVKEVVEKCKESCITGDLGVNVVSLYASRGVVFENQGAIIQPYADIYFKVYEGEGFLNKVSVNLGA